MSLVCGSCTEREKAASRYCPSVCGGREGEARRNREGRSTDAGRAGGPARSSGEAPVSGGGAKGVRRDKPAWRRRWKSSTPKE